MSALGSDVYPAINLPVGVQITWLCSGELVQQVPGGKNKLPCAVFSPLPDLNPFLAFPEVSH